MTVSQAASQLINIVERKRTTESQEKLGEKDFVFYTYLGYTTSENTGL